MPNATLKPGDVEAYVARIKQSWRSHAASLSFEEKIAAIERMWDRDKVLRAAREKIQRQGGTLAD
jgi:hypothetical protein